MDMQAIINQMVVLFLLLALGFTAGKIRLLTEEGTKALSRIILHITTPCTVLNSVMSGGLEITGGEAALFALMSLLAIVLHLIISVPAVRALGGDRKKHGLYRYMSVFGNVANMGFPITMAILGAASAFYVAIYNIPYLLLCYSVGVIMVSGRNGKVDLKLLLNPSLVAGIVVVLIVTTGFKTPAIIADAVRLIGGITTPGSMLVIGATMSGMALKDTFAEWRLYPVVVLKLLVMPVATWFALRPIVANDMALAVIVILSGMASGVMSTIFAIEYGGDERVASSGVFLTTLLSVVTIPLVVFMLLV